MFADMEIAVDLECYRGNYFHIMGLVMCNFLHITWAFTENYKAYYSLTMKMSRKSVWLMVIIFTLVTVGGLLYAYIEANKFFESEKHLTKIGLSLATLSEARWARERDIIVNESRRYGMKVIVQSCEKDEMLQNVQIENMISSGVKAIIIVAQNADTIVPAVKLAEKEDIPTIAYDRAIYCNEVDVYISFDSVKVGYVEAKALLDIVNKGNFLVLCGSPTDDNAYLIKEGQYKALMPYVKMGKIKIVGEYWCDGWNPEEALKHTENALTAMNNNIQAILAPNDGTAGGAIQALAAQGLAGRVPVSGEDAELAACRRIIKGTQTVTVFKDVRKLAKTAVVTVWELLHGMKPSRINSVYENKKRGIRINSIILDVVPVTKSNMREVIVDSGFHRAEDIYGD